MNAQQYSKIHNLPATKAQVRRALQARFKNGEFKKGNILINQKQNILTIRSTHKDITLERLLILYYLFHAKDLKEFFKHIWSL